jgi:hypothetical protein
MSTPESRVEKHFVERVKATGGFVRKLKWIGRNGAPDRIVWWHKHPAVSANPIFVELKRPKGKAAPHQVEEHMKMMSSGLRVFVLDTVEKVDAFVDVYSKAF